MLPAEAGGGASEGEGSAPGPAARQSQQHWHAPALQPAPSTSREGSTLTLNSCEGERAHRGLPLARELASSSSASDEPSKPFSTHRLNCASELSERPLSYRALPATPPQR